MKESTPLKKKGGGTAVGGGMNFQASVTAFVAVHILRNSYLDWIDNSPLGKPTAVLAESEGPGDDLRIELDDGTAVEVQAKKGLRQSNNLWNALISLAEAIHNRKLPFGVLAISPDSSDTICNDLAKDIKVIGDGRTDSLTEIGKKWLSKLKDLKLDFEYVCKRIRIKVIHTLKQDDANIATAKEMLKGICKYENDVQNAWNCLIKEALALIEVRGRWTALELFRLLDRNGITTISKESTASLLYEYNKWTIEFNKYFHIPSHNRSISISNLLPMKLDSYENESSPDALTALENYGRVHDSSRYSSDKFDALWTARFKPHVVIVAGPGLGKTTLIKSLSCQYAQDCYIVLNVALKKVALGMSNGETFTNSLMNHALDSSPLNREKFEEIFPSNKCVVLADGLDECGDLHNSIAEQIKKYSICYPDIKIIVTTRNIGYETKELQEWTHYRLLPPDKKNSKDNIIKLLTTLKEGDIKREDYRFNTPDDSISSSPLLLGMTAAYLYNHNNLPKSSIDIYKKFFMIFEDKISPEIRNQTTYLDLILNIMGWELIQNPIITEDKLVESISKELSKITDQKPISLEGGVQAAIFQWQRVGLVEKVHFEGSALLTFIHKTFCEFAASRYLVKYNENSLGKILKKSSMKEVITFSLGQGFAQNHIKYYLDNHENGEKFQLTKALDLLIEYGSDIDYETRDKLIKQSFDVIDQGLDDMFSIGRRLSTLNSINRETVIVERYAKGRINNSNANVRLIMTAILLNGCTAHDDATIHSNTFEEFIKLIRDHEIKDFIYGMDHGNIQLLQIIALAELKAQKNENALLFAKKF